MRGIGDLLSVATTEPLGVGGAVDWVVFCGGLYIRGMRKSLG